MVKSVRALFEIWNLNHIRIANLDPENTDNLREVVVQYMHENGMTFKILKEDKDEDGNERITIKDEDNRVSVYYLSNIYGFNQEDRLDEDFFIQQISTDQDLEDVCPHCDSREDLEDVCPHCSEDAF